MRFKPSTALVMLLLTAGAWQFGSGLWIQVKAGLAQYLIANAWQQTLIRHRPVKPWPWADTWPVARLRWQDNVDLYVLAGVNGAALPFGPGMEHNVGHNTVLLAGHRDTHFAFLSDLRRGDRLTLTDMQGRAEVFQVQVRQVVDSRYESLAISTDSPVLVMTTCYPLDALRAGGPLRLVVKATAIDENPQANKKKAPYETAPLRITTSGYKI